MPNLYSPEDMNAGYLLDAKYKSIIFRDVEKSELIELDEALSIKSFQINDIYFLQLENTEKEPLALMRLKLITLKSQTYYKVDKATSFVKRKGYITILYEYGFCHLDHPIVSDCTQTKGGSSDVWKKFRDRQFERNYEILIWNTQTDNKGLYTSRNYNDYDIWGLMNSFLEKYNEFPDVLNNKAIIGSYDYFDVLFYPNQEEEDDYFESVTSEEYKRLPIMSKELREFIVNSDGKLKDKEHILLIGQLKSNSKS